MSSVFFDLDGTLTDPREGIVNCLCHALSQLGHPCPPESTLTRYIGPPLRDSFSIILDTNDDHTLDHALRLYRKRFGDRGLFENKVYAGVPEVLQRLTGMERECFVVTSKPTVYAKRITEHFELHRFLRGVYGSNLDGRLTDKKDLIAHILRREKIDPQRCVMVGDRDHDIIGARANGVRVIGVTWGYGSRQELNDARPTAICDTPAQLPRLIESIIPAE